MTIARFDLSANARQSCDNYLLDEAAATKGSYNLAGISDPVVDALVDKAIAAETPGDLTIACRALDRVFRAGRYWVSAMVTRPPTGSPIGTCSAIRRPSPRYARGAPDNWWYDAAKAAKLEQAK